MDIHESLHRILQRAESLADLFYLVFLKEYPEVQQFFGRVDMKQQNILLTMALMAIERHYEHRYEITGAYLKMLGQRHRRLGIGDELYPKWTEAMLATMERFHGPDWNDRLKSQWRAAINAATEVMVGR
jgi:hemoglobin-like flavoprotein